MRFGAWLCKYGGALIVAYCAIILTSLIFILFTADASISEILSANGIYIAYSIFAIWIGLFLISDSKEQRKRAAKLADSLRSVYGEDWIWFRSK